jgi:hypothetical protein
MFITQGQGAILAVLIEDERSAIPAERLSVTLVASFELSAERKVVNVKTRVLESISAFDSRHYSYDSDFRSGADHSGIPFLFAKHRFLKLSFVVVKNLDRDRSNPSGAIKKSKSSLRSSKVQINLSLGCLGWETCGF